MEILAFARNAREAAAPKPIASRRAILRRSCDAISAQCLAHTAVKPVAQTTSQRWPAARGYLLDGVALLLQGGDRK